MEHLGVADGRLVGSLRDPYALRGDAYPAAVEHLHRLAEPLALRSEPVLHRDRAVLEDQLGCGGCPDAHLAVLGVDGEALAVPLHDQGQHTPAPQGRVLGRQHDEGVGLVAVRGE